MAGLTRDALGICGFMRQLLVGTAKGASLILAARDSRGTVMVNPL